VLVLDQLISTPLKLEAICTTQTSVEINGLHGVISQKMILYLRFIFMLFMVFQMAVLKEVPPSQFFSPSKLHTQPTVALAFFILTT
jgi:hypothetical protein